MNYTKYSEYDIEQVRRQADIRDHIPDQTRYGSEYYAKCPACGANGKRKGLKITHTTTKDLAKCFECGFSLNGAIAAEMHYAGTKFTEALETVASKCGYQLVPQSEKAADAVGEMSFCEKQLSLSGLTVEDIMAEVQTSHGVEMLPTFRRGGKRSNVYNTTDDDMLIYYYDLYGLPMKYTPGNGKAPRDLVRVRWSFPDFHKDKSGKPIKYESPRGAEARFYFPQSIRSKFKREETIETLFIQEGEKKAEKACKHGIDSIAIQGIYNIGNKDSGLIHDLQILARTCKVRNIVLLFDADWDNLSREIDPRKSIDARPRQFAGAAIKFKTYIETLHNSDLSIDVWCGHINHNAAGDKGIDDLLCGTLNCHEDELIEDIRQAMKTHNGQGVYASFHKLSSLSDFQIYDLWSLKSPKDFFEKHRDRIKDFTELMFNRVKYVRSDSGELIPKSVSLKDPIWVVTEKESGEKSVTIMYEALYKFLDSNGFRIIQTRETGDDSFKVCRIENGVVETCPVFKVRNFVRDFVRTYAEGDTLVINHILSRIGTIINETFLEGMAQLPDNFNFYEPDYQQRHYSNVQIRITADEIVCGPVIGPVWESRIIKRNFTRVPIIKTFEKDAEGNFTIYATEEGENCEFLDYIVNSCNYWQKGGDDNPPALTADQRNKLLRHLASKMTALGYLLTDYKDPTEAKAIILTDGRISETFKANGRSGKSIFASSLKYITEQLYVGGKQLDTKFMYSTVRTTTRNIFFDDIEPNFPIKRLYTDLTGDMSVNIKQGAIFSIPFSEAPKIVITTNFSISDMDDSTKDRLELLAFSSYYNYDYTPEMEFDHKLFDDWDEYQWNLFDNFMAECVMLYLRCKRDKWEKKGGIIHPPQDNIRARILRQTMGDTFLEWADGYFDPSAGHRNVKIERKEAFDNFHHEYPGQLKYITAYNFKDKLLAYCEYRNLHFNPGKKNKDGLDYDAWQAFGKKDKPIFIGERDVTNGKTFIVVASTEDLKTADFPKSIF